MIEPTGPQQNTAPAPLPSKDKTNSRAVLRPNFLDELATDHAELAKRVEAAIPGWASAVDDFIGRDGFAAAVLHKIDYVSKRETDLFLQNVANEVAALLSRDPKVCAKFLQVSCAGSAQFLFAQVLSRIPVALHDRVLLAECLETGIARDRRDGPPVEYFLLDDSANSGQQFNHLLTPIRSYVDAYRPPSRWRWSREPAPLVVHLRMIRMTDYALTHVLDPLKTRALSHNVPIVFDSTHKRMPVLTDVLSDFGIVARALTEPARSLMGGEERAPILGFFSHRMQDNMPKFLSSECAAWPGQPEALFGPGRRIEKAYAPAPKN